MNRLSRRPFLRGFVGASAVVSLAGCLDSLSGSNDEPPSPVDLSGGMGPELFPFSDEVEASMFAQEYNGALLEFSDIDQALIETLREESHEMGHDHEGHDES